MKTDSELQTDVIQALQWDPSVNHEHIGVLVADKIVTLSGMVPSYYEKFAAEKAAKRVPGLKAVVEKIEVVLPNAHKRDDQDIAKGILSAFKWNIQIPDEAIQMSIENGWVELTGTVDWEYQRTAAEKSVRSMIGVKAVSNNIRIKEKNIQPETIKNNIVQALKREAERDAQNISITVSGNKVTLSGQVQSLGEMKDAKWAAWCSPGVTTVENNLRVIY